MRRQRHERLAFLLERLGPQNHIGSTKPSVSAQDQISLMLMDRTHVGFVDIIFIIFSHPEGPRITANLFTTRGQHPSPKEGFRRRPEEARVILRGRRRVLGLYPHPLRRENTMASAASVGPLRCAVLRNRRSPRHPSGAQGSL
jgi:hypothetical protein